MTLKNCPECNKEVSETASQCPHCGYKLQKGGGSGYLKTLGLVIAIPVGLFVLLFVFNLIKEVISPTDLKNSKSFAIDYGKENLEKSLKDPSSVKYGDVWAGRMVGNTGEGTLVACGYFNARNSFGGMSGMKRFVAGPGGPVLTDESRSGDFETVYMETVWRDACVNNRVQ